MAELQHHSARQLNFQRAEWKAEPGPEIDA